MQLPFGEILDTVRVVSLPLVTRFRGLTRRELAVFEGPRGWTEFSPFVEYPDAEAAVWLRGAIEFGWSAGPSVLHRRVTVNATVPAVPAGEVRAVLDRFPGCRTAKVKVADVGPTLAEDVARVQEVRTLLGPAGRVRLDANGGWSVDEAERAIHALARFDLEYVEQPCGSVAELAELRRRIRHLGIPIAADESVRKATDPLDVVRRGAADLIVVKAAPLGGVTAALRIIQEAQVPVVVSSALESSVGLGMGLLLAAALSGQEYDHGLGTAALLAADVTDHPRSIQDGQLAVDRVAPDSALLDRFAVDTDREQWWRDRMRRCLDLLASAPGGYSPE